MSHATEYTFLVFRCAIIYTRKIIVMNIVTGAGGFIGKHFVKSLENVLEIDLDNCDIFLKDFNKWDEVDMIIHQGALSSTTNKDLGMIHKYNVDYSIKLFEKAIEYGIPVKYASSASVYGNQKGIINPLNYYALSKVTVDYWVLDNIDKFKHIQGFRYFNVYGSGEYHKGTMASLVSQFQWQSSVGSIHPFEGSDEIYRDYVWVGDLVNVVLSNTAGSGIYDLGTGSPTAIGTVAQLVSLKTGCQSIPIPFPPPLKGKYQYYTIADMSWLKDYKFKTIKEYLQV
tara:strand:- start:4828 stop:5679 length:852 start_codon:yes stop_codon:yes gene_type:complete